MPPRRSSGGVLDFREFSFSATANTGSPTLLTASQIEVTPDAVGQGGGFTFTATGGPGFTVGGGQTATYDIDYSFLIEVDPVVSGANIGMAKYMMPRRLGARENGTGWNIRVGLHSGRAWWGHGSLRSISGATRSTSRRGWSRAALQGG